jgi:hypothetical protein
MGFRPERTIYVLNFKDSNLDGLKVRIGGCTVGEWQSQLRMTGTVNSGQEAAESNDAMIALFLKYLQEWDLEDAETGEPVPPTAEGVATQENALITQIILAWQKAMQYVSDDLGKGSTNGSSSREASLGLAGSSQNLQSWPRQNS